MRMENIKNFSSISDLHFRAGASLSHFGETKICTFTENQAMSNEKGHQMKTKCLNGAKFSSLGHKF